MLNEYLWTNSEGLVQTLSKIMYPGISCVVNTSIFFSFFLPYCPTDNKSKSCDAEKNNSQYSNNLYILSLLNDYEPYY